MDSTVIIDNGSGVIKAGFAEDDDPRVVFPSVVGKRRLKLLPYFAQDDKTSYVGEEVQKKRGVLSLKYPIEHGIVTNWDDMKEVWNHVFEELNLDPKSVNRPVLLTESPLIPKKDREKMVEYMFENYNPSDVYLATQGVLSSYAAGRSTGIVFDSGDGVSHIIPICDYSVEKKGVQRLEMAGRDLTHYLSTLLQRNGFAFNNSAGEEIARSIKEKLCEVSLNYDEDMDSSSRVAYELPDKQIINIGKERFRCPEALFRPSLMDMQFVGIHESIYESIMKCDISFRSGLFNNIVLSGGTTMIKHLPERLKMEIVALAPPGMNVNIVFEKDRNFSVWKGGKMLASSAGFKQMCISREEYLDAGAEIVHRKCNEIN